MALLVWLPENRFRDANIRSFKQCVPIDEAAMCSSLVKCSLTAVTEMAHTSDNFTSVKLGTKGWGQGIFRMAKVTFCQVGF